MKADIEERGINVVRALALDAVERARSGHQGTAMALAPLAHVLFTRVMRYDADAPDWLDRDRFVLSAGHASMLQYAYLHLCGFGLTIDDLAAFRQWGSATPGHPEAGHTAGVEVTTGPLGQGFANGVGLAIAERHLRERFGADLVDHRVFAICSDGDLEEGVSHEAASLAGHLGLGRLVYVYDDNHVSIDGVTELAYSDDVVRRFEAYGWHVDDIGEAAEDLDVIEAALRRGIAEQDRPSLVVLRSHIAHPSPKFTDDPAAHGNPFDADEIARVKELMGLPADEELFVPPDVLAYYREAGRRGATARAEWEERLERVQADDPARVAELSAVVEGRGIEGWEAKLPTFAPGESIATRVASRDTLSAIAEVVPGLVGGGADLTGNTGTMLSEFSPMTRDDASGRLCYFGVREHGMGAILNGMAAGGLLAFGGTFFVFLDYMRPAVRLAALSRHRVAFVWSHDSVGVGEDGPTHQPVEHLAMLRATPDLRVIRPADANEVAQAWRVHIEGDGPTAIILTRQGVPVLEATGTRAPEGVARGGYVLVDEHGDEPDVVLVGTGSETHLCVEAAAELAASGIDARVVSLPSWDLFEAQSEEYRDDVLCDSVPTLAVEAASSFGWERYADVALSIDRFGASAPGATVLAELGFTVPDVVAAARALVEELGSETRSDE